MKKIKQYIPLILVEFYLCATLLLMLLGPINYELNNKGKFWLLICAYHVAFIVGYLLVSFHKKKYKLQNTWFSEKNIRKYYWIMLAIGVLVWMVAYRNGTRASSYIPYELPENFITGLLHPAERYYWKFSDEALSQFQGNKLVTGCASLVYPLYYCIPASMIYMWDKISKSQKILSYVQIFLSLSIGISIGTNKYIFDIVFILLGGIIIEMFCSEEGFKILKKRKLIVFTTVFLCIFAVWYFTFNLRDRVGNMSKYVVSGNDDITMDKPSGKDYEGFLNSMLVGAESYLCQGYYGFSLALDQEFTSTYGLGHSTFILVTVDGMLGTDLTSRTYQFKISDRWSNKSRWHSFYSQMANDVGFYGVILVMLVLGALLAQVWKDACEDNDVIAKNMLILFVIMFIYMSANNQVGNFSGTFFSFWELLFVLGAEHIAIHVKNRKPKS